MRRTLEPGFGLGGASHVDLTRQFGDIGKDRHVVVADFDEATMNGGAHFFAVGGADGHRTDAEKPKEGDDHHDHGHGHGGGGGMPGMGGMGGMGGMDF